MTTRPSPSRRLVDYPHRHDLVTRRSDSVGDGHIPNAALCAYFDDAREPLHQAIIGDDPYQDTGRLSLVLAEIGLRFIAEVRYPGPLTIGVGLIRIGSSSLDEVAGFFRDGECLALAWCTMVKLVERRPAPLSAAERAAADRYLAGASSAA